MNIYDAIMAAADHIERHPEEFEYGCVQVPDYPGCGAPGCALGWIGYFLGVKGRVAFASHVLIRGSYDYEGLTCHDGQFYQRMNRIQVNGNWVFSPDACAAALRAYARQYHAPRTLDWESLAAPGAGTREEVST